MAELIIVYLLILSLFCIASYTFGEGSFVSSLPCIFNWLNMKSDYKYQDNIES